MKSALTLFFSFIACLQGFAQIDISFLSEKSSNAILLRDRTEFNIFKDNKSSLKRNYEAVIKNGHASSLTNVVIHYDQFQKVKHAEIVLKSLDGKVIEEYKLRDFEDWTTDFSGVASDARAKVLKPVYSRYPYVISVSYEVEKEGSLHYPIWMPQSAEKLRVISAKFVVNDYENNAFRYEAKNVQKPEITTLVDRKTYVWKVKDLDPFEVEKYSYSIEEYAPVVYTAPTVFQMEYYRGDMHTWNSFGKWIQKLNAGKNDLDGTDLTDLDQLVAQAGSAEEKVKIVYDYLQNNTRYVSIQLGIGGWQPFSSSFVHEKKYGDCKALSFYTKSLLERYGIEGHYTLIRAGRGAANVSKDFPNAHFNHAILTVPLEQDTVFLECTSQTNPYGYLGTFTSNRNALLITPEGGKLIRTKKYTVEDNVQKTKVVVDLSKEGDAKVSFTRTFTGIEIENYGFEHLYYKSEKEQSEWFVDNHEWGDMKLDHFSMESMQEGEVPEAGFQAAFIVNNEAKKMGSRLFLKPGKYVDSFVSKLSSDERKKPITIRYGYTQIDTIIYETPVYFHFEKGLDEVKMDTKYGYYQRSMNRSGEKIIYTRQFILKDGKYAPEEYEAFKNFINSVNKYDRQRVVVKGET